VNAAPTYDFSQIKVHGQPLKDRPPKLWIPPEALEIYLETFEGPLDVLLYLIRKQKFNIQDLPVVPLTQQYLEYLRTLQQLKINLAADYLVMAATLLHLKSQTLLPEKPKVVAEVEEDPRQALIDKLHAYQNYKQAAQVLAQTHQVNREVYLANVAHPSGQTEPKLDIQWSELLQVVQKMAKKHKKDQPHRIQAEPIDPETCMQAILASLKKLSRCRLENILDASQGALSLVVSFVALLQLIKQGHVHLQAPAKDLFFYVSLP
jgi:segregation and condensation protein A